jgi:hypothetical protein
MTSSEVWIIQSEKRGEFELEISWIRWEVVVEASGGGLEGENAPTSP